MPGLKYYKNMRANPCMLKRLEGMQASRTIDSMRPF